MVTSSDLLQHQATRTPVLVHQTRQSYCDQTRQSYCDQARQSYCTSIVLNESVFRLERQNIRPPALPVEFSTETLTPSLQNHLTPPKQFVLQKNVDDGTVKKSKGWMRQWRNERGSDLVFPQLYFFRSGI